MNPSLKISKICTPQAYQRLKSYIIAKSPNFPERYLVPPERYFYGNTQHREYLSKWLESVITNILNFKGHMAKKVETVGKQIKSKSGKQVWIKHRASKKGEPDVMAIIGGRAVYFEVKIGNDRLSPDQQEYIDRLRNAGAQVHIIKTVDEFLQIIDNLKTLTHEH